MIKVTRQNEQTVVLTDELGLEVVIYADDNEHQFAVKAKYKNMNFEDVFAEVDSTIGKYVGIDGAFEGLVFTAQEGNYGVLTPPEVMSFDSNSPLPMIVRYLDIDVFYLQVDNVVVYLKPQGYMFEGPADWFKLHVYDSGKEIGQFDTRKAW